MADDQLDVATATHGVVPLRARDADGAGKQAQKVDVAPWVPATTGVAVRITVTTATPTGKSGAAGGQFTFAAGTTHVVIAVEGNTVNMTEDGSTTPSSIAGIPLPAGFIGEWPLAMNLNFIAIGGSATLTLLPRKYV